ncbi:MAG: hypothetical protein ACRCSP_04095 [Rhodoglobus sp.]
MFGFSLLLNGVIFLLTFGVVGGVSFWAFGRMDAATGDDADAVAAGSVATIVLSSLVPVALSILITAILQGIVALEVARGTVGEKLTLGGLWRAAKGRIGAVIGWSLLLSGGALAVLIVLGTLIGLIIGFGGVAGLVIGILLTILAVGGGLVLWAWLGTRLCLVPSVLMIERLPLRAAVARSWSLSTGFFWKTLGIQLLVAVIVQTVAGIVGAPLQLVSTVVGGVLGSGSGADSVGVVVGLGVISVLSIVLLVAFSAITSVVQSATPALIYIDIRMRKEGLDLELNRFVEARQAGQTSIPDPYLPRSTEYAAPQATAQPSPWS